MRTSLIVLGLGLASPLLAQTPVSTVQQRFDAARAKLDAHDAAGALEELKSLEAFIEAQTPLNPTNLAVTRAQQAEALVKLGRGAEAKPLLRQALDGPGLDKPALAPVRDNSRLMLANVLEAELDHASADAEYLRLAAQTAEPITRTVALMGAARTEMFTDAAGALRHIDEALAIAEKDPSVGKGELANVLGLKGRILINGGRYADARELLVRAVSLRGGLTQKVFLQDVALRADAAIAMLELGQSEDARKYLAYTGAGRTEVQLDPPREMPLPSCGGLEAFSPDDSAVIEFSILDDGRVVGAHPVYASRQGEVAYQLARAVERWSWEAGNAAKVKPFFRLATRVEIRCSNKTDRPEMMAPFDVALREWASGAGVAVPEAASDAALAVKMKQRLAALSPGDSPQRLVLLALLARNSVVEGEQRVAHAAEAFALGQRLHVPSPVLFDLALYNASIGATADSNSWTGGIARRVTAYRQLLPMPAFAEPKMQATLQLQIAQDAALLRRSDEESAALTAVTQTPGLTEHDPLRVAAWVQLANLYAAAKRLDEAATAYDHTGLSARQCALIDGGPVMRRTGASSSDFPEEAFTWGFEGWTAMEFDVAADGSTRNQRIVAAFPPRIFVKATEGIARQARYSVSYRPEGDLACTAMSRKVRYSIPSR